MIQIRGLTLFFNQHCIIDDLNLDIHKHDIIAIIGSSGAGKSTLLRCFNLLEKPQSGVITIDGQKIDLANINKKEIVNFRQQSAMVFQQFNLFQQKTALENVMEGLLIVKKTRKKEAHQLALKQLIQVGLEDRIHHYPKQLSGGQQQRVAIARALAMVPKVLLLDEPTSALDPELVGEVLITIKNAAKLGNTMVLVSHEMSFVREIATRVIFLDKGKIIEDAPPEIFFTRPKHQRTHNFLARYHESFESDYSI